MVGLRPEGVVKTVEAQLIQEGYPDETPPLKVAIELGKGLVNVVVLGPKGEPVGAVMVLYVGALYGNRVEARVYDIDECRRERPSRPLSVALAYKQDLQTT